eukprot:CAMPEP_0115005034 /NCGR_PEP_ID=MMETSP0216-20121206/19610_1 /TAXON_ID=223996 /ORGANISM="Protocruzia adherens, Strain Boccale" /LENGTH=503 /DNA_ID=CAMNT_0002371241 /DNA_START=80 /DNA_END=1591 /DNA_ORIENTATION=-
MSSSKDESKKPTEEGKKEEKKETPAPPKKLAPSEVLRNGLISLEKAAALKNIKNISGVIHQITFFRKHINARILTKLTQIFDPSYAEDLASLEVQKADQEMEVDEKSKGQKKEVVDNEEALNFQPKVITRFSRVLEIELFVSLLRLVFFIDHKQYTKAEEFSHDLILRFKTLNRRTLDPISAKVVYYYSFSVEKQNKLQTIRPLLFELYRTACLQHDELGQATLLNLLMRNYLHYNSYELARNLSAKSTFPEKFNNQLARYLYYTGRIKVVQLDYADAQANLTQAMRKAPEHGALGFKVEVQKLLVIIELLMGELPDRNLFSSKPFKKALKPYFVVTQAVKRGDLAQFNKNLQEYAKVFEEDRNYSLVARLRHNVLKTGLKRINISYSRISLQDIATKLSLDSVQETEYIVAKAIRDEVITAELNHEGQYLQSKEIHNTYTTTEPQEQFNKRISFCLELHNDAVKAMTFPEKKEKKIDSAEDRKQKLLVEKELAEGGFSEDEF